MSWKNPVRVVNLKPEISCKNPSKFWDFLKSWDIVRIPWIILRFPGILFTPEFIFARVSRGKWTTDSNFYKILHLTVFFIQNLRILKNCQTWGVCSWWTLGALNENCCTPNQKQLLSGEAPIQHGGKMASLEVWQMI